MTTIATLCTGFDGVGAGAKAAGLELAWGIELEPRLAEVANANLGKHVCVANLLECDPFDFDKVDVLHASPTCTSASQANANSGETALDLAMGHKIAEFVTVLKPPIFTLENVWAYRRFQAWRAIEDALHEAGYWVSVEHCNAADYGVPQTRKRMIVRAIRGGFVPYLPEPAPWVGWYAAVADLLDELPDSQFAPWQLARLPELLASTLVGVGGFDNHVTMSPQSEPSMTVTSNENMLTMRAFLMAGGGNTNFEEAYPGRGCRYAAEPAHTVTATSKEGGAMPKAWLDMGRVVAMTPRALARFQSFPDWYQLPDNARLAAKGIGNAVPPLLYQRVIESMLTALPSPTTTAAGPQACGSKRGMG